ncbi:MAG: AMP-binding protein, partial [Arenibacterium sp.]
MERWHGFLDDQIAARPDARAVSDSTGVDWTYADLNAACSDIETHLKDAGVLPGDRVMVLIENCGAAMAAVFAASRMGAIAVPVNARQTEGELRRILEHARPRVVLFTTTSSKDAQTHASAMNATEIGGSFCAPHMATPFENDPADLPDFAVLLYTTGTTGTPKSVSLKHNNLRFCARDS